MIEVIIGHWMSYISTPYVLTEPQNVTAIHRSQSQAIQIVGRASFRDIWADIFVHNSKWETRLAEVDEQIISRVALKN